MANRPKFEPQTNIPVTVELTYLPSEAKENEWGQYWLFGIREGEVEKSWFVNDKLQGVLSAYSKGDSIVVCKREGKNKETGKPYHYFEVNSAVFDEHGRVASPPKEKVEPGSEEYRRIRMDALQAAILDVMTVEDALRKNLPDEQLYLDKVFSGENIQKFATTFLIDLQRKA